MSHEASRTEVEKIMVEIWKDVLKVEQIGINENFLSLGGDSIKALQMAARLKKHLIKVDVEDVLNYPTITELATHVEFLREDEFNSSTKDDTSHTELDTERVDEFYRFLEQMENE